MTVWACDVCGFVAVPSCRSDREQHRRFHQAFVDALRSKSRKRRIVPDCGAWGVAIVRPWALVVCPRPPLRTH